MSMVRDFGTPMLKDRGNNFNKAMVQYMADSDVHSGQFVTIRFKVQELKHRLVNASEKGDLNTVKNLLERTRINPNLKVLREGLGKSPLHLACNYGQTEVVEELLKGGANPLVKTTSGRTPLHECCVGGNVQCLTLLLDFTQDLDDQDADGQTAVHMAAYHGEKGCCSLLADKGANLVMENNQGRQPAHLAAMRNHKKILELLFHHNIDLDSRCDLGKTPLHYAAQHGSLSSIIALVERDGDITLGDKHGYLPCHLAARYDQVDCLRFFIKQGLSHEVAQNEGRTPAHVAALHGSVKCLHWLLDKDVDPCTQDDFGNTVGHFAADGGKGDCFNCYLQHGGPLDILNKKGDSPLDAAKKSGHPVLMENAVKNVVTCPLCFQKFQRVEWDKAHAPASVERNITIARSTAYISPLPPRQKTLTQLEKNRQKSEAKKLMNASKNLMPGRDLPAKFYGQYVDPNNKFKFDS